MKNKGQDGVALLLVMSSLVFLSVLLVDFSYDVELNKIKAANMNEKIQARLNAESGLKLSLAKLRLYRAVRNRLAKNKNLQGVFSDNMIEEAILYPFIYPIPIGEKADLVQKNIVAEFEKNSLVQGSINVSVERIRGFLNPNKMRPTKKQDKDEGEDKLSMEDIVESEILQVLNKLMDQQREHDVDFASEYGDLEPVMLVKELKFYVNDPENFHDPQKAQLENLYAENGLVPKHAPLSSLEELYLLAGWPDAIVDLIKDHLSVHEVRTIPINDLTKDQLEALFPSLEADQVDEFFKYRDGDEENDVEPSPFRSVRSFQALLVGKLGVDKATYEERIKELAKANLQLGTFGRLFKVVSVGSYNRVSYKISAFVSLPVQPPPPPKKKRGRKKKNDKNSPNKPPARQNQRGKSPPEELREPRVVEIRIG